MTYEEIYKELKKKITKDVGTRCPQFEFNCFICQQWLMLDVLRDDIFLEKSS